MAASDLASNNLEQAFGPYTVSSHSTWSPFWDQKDADDFPDHPNIWTDGSREPIPHLDVEIAGAGRSPTPPLLFSIAIGGVTPKTKMAGLRVAPISFVGFSVPRNQYRELNIGELSKLYKLTLESILASTI